MSRELARGAARRVAPGYVANRARRYERALRQRNGATDLAQRLVANGRPVVRAGPFAGLTYPAGRLADVDAAIAKLLGTYEREIAWVFERAIALRLPTFIDIGCADGYYAAGMAHASPSTTTLAYDLASSARELCAETATASAVRERVRIRKRFTVDSLSAVDPAGALVLCDIEGGEVELLGSSAAAALRASVVVVEVHEDERPGAGDRLRAAFAHTHTCLTISQQPRRDAPAPLADWGVNDRVHALREFRGPLLHWMLFEPRGR